MKLFSRPETSDEFQVLNRKLDSIQRSLDQLDHDMQGDRFDISELKIRQGRIDDQLQEIRQLWKSQTDTLKQTVDDSITEGVKEIKEEIVKEGGEQS